MHWLNSLSRTLISGLLDRFGQRVGTAELFNHPPAHRLTYQRVPNNLFCDCCRYNLTSNVLEELGGGEKKRIRQTLFPNDYEWVRWSLFLNHFHINERGSRFSFFQTGEYDVFIYLKWVISQFACGLLSRACFQYVQSSKGKIVTRRRPERMVFELFPDAGYIEH